jgi:tRNA(fMet)-specific endonuclease VapC
LVFLCNRRRDGGRFSNPAKAIHEYRQLRALKLNVGKKDLCIAAIGRALSATVVTGNLSDFGRVPGLAVEDWTK